MRNEDKSLIGISPIYHTMIFEMKKQRKKLYFFTFIAILIAVLTGYILQLFPDFLLSATQAEFFSGGLNFISFITLFAACLFFSGIISNSCCIHCCSVLSYPRTFWISILWGTY
ncbi:MAG: hypothetical protein ACTSQT_06100 [Promethearchaeota archaeon]